MKAMNLERNAKVRAGSPARCSSGATARERWPMATDARLAEAEPKAHLAVTRRGSRSFGSPGYLGLWHAAQKAPEPRAGLQTARALSPWARKVAVSTQKAWTLVVATRKALAPGHY